MKKHLIVRFIPFWILTFVNICITAAMIVHGKNNSIDLSYFSRDLNALADNPWYFGAVTFICSFFWSFTVAICFFAYTLLRKVFIKQAHFFLLIGIFSTILLLDDIFMIHEDIFPNHLGIPERIIYLIYFILVVYVVKKHLYFIRKTNYIILFTGMFLLGFSAFFDILANDVMEDKNFYEDVFKLFGTTFWFYYFFDTGYHAVKDSLLNIQVSQKIPELKNEKSEKSNI